MSWIEDPGVDSVGADRFEELGIDQAFLHVSSSLKKPMWLYSLATNCYKCPYKLMEDFGNITNQEKVSPVSTVFAVKYKFRTSDTPSLIPFDADDNETFCNTGELRFGQFGIYDLRASNETSSCFELNEIHPPVSIYYAFVIFAIVYLLLALGIYGIKYLQNRRNRKSDSEQILQPTSISSSAQDSPGQTPPPKEAPRQRLKSLDTFRGICIVVMIFVNDGGAHYFFLEHAPWDGLYVADLVFPWFLWIMGVCIPVSIKSQRKRNTPTIKIVTRIGVRSLKLIGIGLILASLWGPVELRELRIPGVLQRFGVTYFVCSMLVLFFLNLELDTSKSNKFRKAMKDVEIIWIGWIATLLIVLVHTLITFFLDVPECGRGYLGPGGLHNNAEYKSSCIGGAAGYIDRQIFTVKHIYNYPTANDVYSQGQGTPYDPEGLLGTLTAVLQVWCGVQTGVTMLVFPDAWSRLKRWLGWAVILGAIGAILCQAKESGGWIPVNKNLWSLSFVMVTCCLALLLLSLFYFIIDMKHWWNGSPFYEPGMNSILLYVGHSVGNSCLPWHWAYGRMETHVMRLFESLWGTSLWVVVAIYLDKKKKYWIL